MIWLKQLFASVLVLTIALAASYFLIRENRLTSALAVRGITTRAEVIGSEIRTKRGSGSTLWYLKVRYRVRDQYYEVEDMVPKNVFENHASPTSVKYLPENPKEAHIALPDLPADYYVPPYWPWLVVIAMGGYGGYRLVDSVRGLLKRTRTPAS
jgi:hypothetical protein